jgi:hypothetical protein
MIEVDYGLEFDEMQKMMKVPVYRGGNGIGKKKPRIIRTPYDFLKGYKAKRRYTGVSGEVVIYNMFDKDNLLSLDEIENLGDEQASEYVKKAREFYNNQELQKFWGINYYTLYTKVYKKYGVLMEKGGSGTTKGGVNRYQKVEKDNDVVKEVKSVRAVNRKSFSIGMEGDYDGEELAEKLLKLTDIINSSGKYTVVINLTEE